MPHNKMLFKAITISCLLALACGAPANDGGRIVGGHNAEPGQFKHQVSLQLNGGHLCGGSIISSKAVATAAHCKIGSISSLAVVTGTTTLGSGTSYKVKSFTIHEDWNTSTLENDVAVIIIDGEIEFNDLVGPIKLASYDIAGDVPALTSGWGYTSYPGSTPRDLQWFETKTMSYEQCSGMVGGVLRSQLCTLTKSGEGVCSGDSGGPLIKDGELHGITSAAYLCALGLPDFFTRVYSFVDWIEAHAQ